VPMLAVLAKGREGRATMRMIKKTVMFTVVLLACAGVYSALRNMPVLSGCSFYGECPDDAASPELSTVASMDPTSEATTP
jgi:hypothetical protein